MADFNWTVRIRGWEIFPLKARATITRRIQPVSGPYAPGYSYRNGFLLRLSDEQMIVGFRRPVVTYG